MKLAEAFRAKKPMLDEINGDGAQDTLDATREARRKATEARHKEIVAAMGSEATGYVLRATKSRELHSDEAKVVATEEDSSAETIDITTS